MNEKNLQYLRDKLDANDWEPGEAEHYLRIALGDLEAAQKERQEAISLVATLVQMLPEKERSLVLQVMSERLADA